MKVRCPSNLFEYEVVDESSIHWIVINHRQPGPRLALPKAEFKPIPEEKWVDVTAGCTVEEDPVTTTTVVRYCGEDAAIAMRGYRLSRVLVGEERRCIGFAFIMEKKDA